MNETAIIHPYIKKSREFKDLLLSEAKSLVNAIDLNIVYSKAVGLDKINSKTYLRSGFISNLKQIIIDLKVKLTFINACITPIQQRNLENATKCKIIDRNRSRCEYD